MFQPSFADLNNIVITSEDDFEIITMYGKQPTFPSRMNSEQSNTLPYSVNPTVSYRPANEIAYQNHVPESLQPLDGIHFKLAPGLELSSLLTQDPVFEDVRKTLERVKNLLNSKDFTYDLYAINYRLNTIYQVSNNYVRC